MVKRSSLPFLIASGLRFPCSPLLSHTAHPQFSLQPLPRPPPPSLPPLPSMPPLAPTFVHPNGLRHNKSGEALFCLRAASEVSSCIRHKISLMPVQRVGKRRPTVASSLAPTMLFSRWLTCLHPLTCFRTSGGDRFPPTQRAGSSSRELARSRHRR